MTDHDVHLLAGVYALDALDERERADFEIHLAGCESCRAEVAGFTSTSAPLAQSQAAAPTPSLKTRVLAEVSQTRQLSPLVDRSSGGRNHLGHRGSANASARRYWLLAAAAVALLAVVVVGIAVLVPDETTDRFAEDLALVLEQPDAQMLGLTGQPPATLAGQSGQFKVAWSNSLHRAVLIGEGLSPAPQGKAYELWLITPDQSMAMRILDSATDGTVHASFDMPQTPTTWAVTIEPHSGAEVATGEIIFVGSTT